LAAQLWNPRCLHLRGELPPAPGYGENPCATNAAPLTTPSLRHRHFPGGNAAAAAAAAAAASECPTGETKTAALPLAAAAAAASGSGSGSGSEAGARRSTTDTVVGRATGSIAGRATGTTSAKESSGAATEAGISITAAVDPGAHLNPNPKPLFFEGPDTGREQLGEAYTYQQPRVLGTPALYPPNHPLITRRHRSGERRRRSRSRSSGRASDRPTDWEVLIPGYEELSAGDKCVLWPPSLARERGPGGLTREVETPLPSNSPHDHMILREELVGSHGRWRRPCLQTAHMTKWY
jgi:hypothetical protein